MKTWLSMLCACLALGLVVAGCGGDDDEESSGADTSQEQPTETQAEEPSGGEPAAKAASVSMKEIQFDPADVTVAKGGTVTWTNDDSVGHDVTKKDGPGPNFKSGEAGAMDGGDTFKATFETAGEINYVCTVHPAMKGTVTVQ